MADSLPPVVIEIQAQTADLQKQIDDIKTKLGSMGAAAEEQKSKVSGLTTGLKELAKVAAEAFAAAEVINFLKESTQAAAELGSQQAILANQLKNSTGATSAQVAAVNKNVQAMSEQYGVLQTDINPAMTQLTRVTGNVGDATKLTQLAMNISAGTGKDLTSVAIALGKAHDGNTTSLQRLGINVKNLKDPFTELQKQFDGAAKKAADANPYKTMQVALEDIQTTIGKALLPVVGVLANVLKDIMPVIEMVASFFGKLVQAVMPIVTTLMRLLMPILESVIEIILNLAKTVLPMVITAIKFWLPWLEMIAAVVNIVLKVVAFLTGAFAKFAEMLVNSVGKAIKAFLDQFGPLGKAIEGLFNGLMKLAGMKPINLSVGGDIMDPKKLDFSAMDLAAISKGGTTTTGAGGAASKAVSKHQAAVEKFTAAMTAATEKATATQQKYADAVTNAQATYSQAVEKAQTAYADSTAAAQQTYADARDRALSSYNDAIAAAEQTRADSLQTLEANHADALLKIQADYSSKLKGIVAQSMAELTNAFQQATATNVGTMFADLSKTGAVSADQLLTSLKDRLASIQKLSQDAARLAGAGYSQTFIEQVVSQGPQVGDQMTQSLLNASPDQQKAIQSNFDAINTASTTGVSQLAQTLYNQQGLATQQLKDLYATTLSDQAQAVAQENQNYVDAQFKINDTYNNAVVKATDIRDKALSAAQTALDKAMTAAADARDKAMTAAQDALSNSLTKAEQALNATLTSINNSIDATISKMGNLNATAASKALGAAKITAPVTVNVPQVQTSAGQMSFSAADAGGLTVINNVTGTNLTATQLTESTVSAISYGRAL